ncbi:type 1 glutamine amidotransferase [Desulfobulbus rhabdoformis]|uniref:type 1 glutamine amidotransferase n=1 Tax=Desulfobulbus rhabdoformis TaxID=34032 RepID=UPI00196425E3|nr:type 1 glutamine amidotransferase [Desulfobulbus rhabdoformis]MBM9613877.1 type 1 glutamine amidotransferase [Desulfobulbus rhabdoformis]
MRLHYLQHVPFEGLGSIEHWAVSSGGQISCTRLYAGDRLPALVDFDYLVVMGGPMNIYEEAKYPWLAREKEFLQEAVAADKPILGICLGAQLIADVLGAQVYKNTEKEIGWFPINIAQEAPEEIRSLFPVDLRVMHWHGDTFNLPKGSVLLARSQACPHQGFIYKNRVIGLQFHLETTKESLQSLIDHCADEIIEAPFIQQPDEMQQDQSRFLAINSVMSGLLNYWTR